MKKNVPGNWVFLLIMMLVYCCLFLTNSYLFTKTYDFLIKMTARIIPVFLLVFILMILINYFIDSKLIKDNFSSKGLRRWFFAIAGGIISSGPIYMWYPFLKTLVEKGMTKGTIACFIYNKGIKIPMIPVSIFYFGLTYTIILTLVMIASSISQALIIDKIIFNK